MTNRTRTQANCKTCGKEFFPALTEVKRGKGLCCSLSCAAALAATVRDNFGPANNNWRGGASKKPVYKLERIQRYRKANPKKYEAHRALTNAVRRGALAKQPCRVCGAAEKVEGHHPDYEKPLEVIWLCKSHHMEEHKRKRAE